MTTEQVDLRRSGTTEVIRAEELIVRRKAFADKGFSPEWINVLEAGRPTLYSPSILTDHIAGLKERGFSNPNKMIESSPAILGLAFENIDRRLRLIGSIVNLYGVPFRVQELMENQNGLFSSKIDKIVILVRVLRKTAQNPEEVTNAIINRFLFSNLEDVLVAIEMLQPNENVGPNELLKKVKEIKAAGFTKEEKQNAIKQGLRNDSKIKSRYLKGYPIKE